MKHEEKIEPRSGSLQCEEEGAESRCRAKIKSIREGHTTGGYIATEALQEEEKKLWRILTDKLAVEEKKHGTHHRAEFQHPEVRRLRVELNGLAFKPQLVVKEAQ